MYEHMTFVIGKLNRLSYQFVMPPPFIMGGGHIASPLSVRPYVRPYIRTYVPYVRKMVSGRYLLNTLVYWIHISYKDI